MGVPDPNSAHRADAQGARRRAHTFLASTVSELTLAAAHHASAKDRETAAMLLDVADRAATLRRQLEAVEQIHHARRAMSPIFPKEVPDGS